MSDELWRLQIKRRWRRRKRSVVGKEWQPPTLQDVGAGAWCRRCHVRHPYNGKNKLRIEYEVRSGRNVLLWICPISNDVVGELWLGSS